MMEGIKAYVLSVTAGAILCGLVTSLSGKKGVQKGVIRLLTGAFLIVTVIAPLAKVKIQDLQDYLGDISLQSEAVAAEGENFANAQVAGYEILQGAFLVRGQGTGQGDRPRHRWVLFT